VAAPALRLRLRRTAGRSTLLLVAATATHQVLRVTQGSANTHGIMIDSRTNHDPTPSKMPGV